jgi:hypothetical protein
MESVVVDATGPATEEARAEESQMVPPQVAAEDVMKKAKEAAREHKLVVTKCQLDRGVMDPER